MHPPALLNCTKPACDRFIYVPVQAPSPTAGLPHENLPKLGPAHIGAIIAIGTIAVFFLIIILILLKCRPKGQQLWRQRQHMGRLPR